MTDQDRRTNNLFILNELERLVESFPDLRFGQIIEVFVKDREGSDFFYEEPDLTLKRLKENVLKYGC